jgi:hypothetical protein
MSMPSFALTTAPLIQALELQKRAALSSIGTDPTEGTVLH